jgi:hypothetical protein
VLAFERRRSRRPWVPPDIRSISRQGPKMLICCVNPGKIAFWDHKLGVQRHKLGLEDANLWQPFG